jgi:hypothetical protein
MTFKTIFKIFLILLLVATVSCSDKDESTDLEQLSMRGGLDVDLDSNDILDAAYGGTNVDSSAWTGFTYITAGVWAQLASISNTHIAADADIAASKLDIDSADIQAEGTPSSNETYSGIPVMGINAGEDIEFGELVKLHTDGEWHLADKDDGIPAFGYAVECPSPNDWTCQDGEEMYVLPIGEGGSIRDDSWTIFVAGDIVYLADDGIFDELADITYTAGDVRQAVGMMQEEDIMLPIMPPNRLLGIADNYIVEMDDADATDNDYAKFTANGLEGRSYAEVKQDLDLEIGIDILAQQTIGIADNNLVEIDGTAETNDIPQFTANGLKGLTYAELATAIEAALESVLDLADLQGAVTDGQVPNDITVTLAATATAAAVQAITDNAIATVDDADTADNDYSKFTADGLEGRSYAEVRTDLGIDSIANFETTLSAGAYFSDIAAATSEANFKSIVNLEIDTDVRAYSYDGTPASDNTYSCGLVITGIDAGEAVKEFDLVILATDGKWDMANADDGVSPIGIAVGAPDDGFPAADTEELYVCLLGAGGVIRNDGWTGHTAGEIVYMSETDGLFDPADEIDLEDGDAWVAVGQMQEEDIFIFPVPAWATDDGN